MTLNVQGCLGMAAALLLQGCASPGQPVQQAVMVETPGCARAQCTLSNDRGSWAVASTPGAVSLLTSHTALKVTCRALDGTEGRTGAASSLHALGNTGTVVGGAIGTGVGLAAAAPAMAFIPALGVVIAAVGTIVGAGSGQAIESQGRAIRYPDLITVPMNCEPSAPAATVQALQRFTFGFSVLGLTPAQGLAAGIGERGAVLVSAVSDEGAAAAAGLKRGDIVVFAGDQPIMDASVLEQRVQAIGAGQSLALRVWRDGRSLVLVLARPETQL